jgi:hypothetical protein
MPCRYLAFGFHAGAFVGTTVTVGCGLLACCPGSAEPLQPEVRTTMEKARNMVRTIKPNGDLRKAFIVLSSLVLVAVLCLLLLYRYFALFKNNSPYFFDEACYTDIHDAMWLDYHIRIRKGLFLMIDVALATYANLPDLDADNALLLPALAERGLRARPIVWNDPTMDWSLPKLTVIRSTWDYHYQRPAFLSWAEQVSHFHNIYNPFAILRWNTHKSYLRDLERQNIPIVPTIWQRQGTRTNLSSLMEQHNWQKIVLKPAVSASAHGTILVTAETMQDGQSHLDRMLSTHDMLIQPFLSTVTRSHERSLIFIDGEFTHAIKRKPALDLDPSAQNLLITPQEDELLLAQKILRLLPSLPLYARIDLLHDEVGTLRLMELELVEPGLWLSFAPHSIQLFADAIARKVPT